MAFQQHQRDVLSKLQQDIPEDVLSNALSRLASSLKIIEKDEFSGAYLPLALLIHRRLAVFKAFRAQGDQRHGHPPNKAPFMIGLAGSVAVGKSTVAKILQQALASWPEYPEVTLVNSDGFLFANAELERRGLLDRKGFPESFDWYAIVHFIRRLQFGETGVTVPTYSHAIYDILPGPGQVIGTPDIVIFEGINTLQPPYIDGANNRPFPVDIYDYTIYVHADEALIKQWYTARFLALTEAAANDPQSFYSRFSPLTLEQRVAVVNFVWETINGKNLNDHILPSQVNADLVIHKGEGHMITHFETRNPI
jgi:type I pantothenate kinase